MLVLAQQLMPFGVVLLQAGCFILLLALLFAHDSSLVKFVGKNAVLLSFLATLCAISGSLFYSNVIGFEPCILCWWQRIFMYPQVFIFAVAVWYRRRDLPVEDSPSVLRYTLPLSIIGALIAIYHILLPVLGKFGSACLTSASVSCAKLYIFAFGYITIPVMSLTIFVTLILIALTSMVKSSSQGLVSLGLKK